MTRAEKVAQLGSFWAFEVVARIGPRRGRAGRARRGRHRRDHPAGRIDEPAAGRGRRGRERDPALPRRGDAARDPGDRPRGVPARPASPGPRRASSSRSGRRRASTPTSSSAMAATIRRRMLADRRPARPGPGPRHRPRPALGPDRGDLRRGPVPRGRARAAPTSEALQGPDLADGVVATAKHMVGHGLAEGGLNQAPAHIGPRELRDEQLFPFEAAVRRVGHRERHAGLLRRGRRALPRLGRAADRRSCATSGASTASSPRTTSGVEMIATAHRLTADLGEAARLALVAGVDVELPRTVAFGAPLEAALERRPGRRGRRSTRPSRACCG